MCAFLLQHFLAGSFFLQTRGGDSKAVSSGRCDRDRWAVPSGFHSEFLHRSPGARAARTEREPVVRREIPGGAAYLGDTRIAGVLLKKSGGGFFGDGQGVSKELSGL